MDHSVIVEGPAFRLRPVRKSDAKFIIKLRTDPDLGHFLNPTSERVEDQIEYLERYFKREGDYYFIVERKNTDSPEGIVAVYDIDKKDNCGEWGRWILKHKSMGAVESVLLIYQVAFEILGLDMAYCRTVLANERAVSFQDSTGVKRFKILKEYAQLSIGSFDSVEHRLKKSEWPEIKDKLQIIAEKVERLVRQD